VPNVFRVCQFYLNYGAKVQTLSGLWAAGIVQTLPGQFERSNFVRDGDTVFCHSMDRLARNIDDLRRIVLGLAERGVHIVFVKENLTFTGEDKPMSNLLLSVIGAFAQFERELIRERQREGIAIAKREGKYRGRNQPRDGLQSLPRKSSRRNRELSREM